MTGAAEFFEELRREYLAEAPARLSEMRKDLAAWAAGEPDAANSLKVRFHRLAGSGGSYGFPDISQLARTTERWIGANPNPDPAGASHVESAIAALASIFDQGAVAVGLPQMAQPKPRAFGWQALLLGSSGELAVQVEATLSDAQYTVQRKPLGFDPKAIPVSERPDVAVILGTTGAETEGVIGTWAAPGATRPPSVVLVSRGESADPLAEPYASLDAIIRAGNVESDLLSFVRALGRAATAPRSILVVDSDDAGATRTLVNALDGAAVRVAIVAGGQAARAALEHEAWDLIVTDWRIAETTGPALIRWIRSQPHYRLTPVVVFAAQMSDDERLAAIRAGADDVLIKASATSYVAQALLARIERNRAIRAVAHRDDLTGLLNQEAVHEELQRAVSAARRGNESVGFLMFDLDHFRRVNEQHGSGAGDGILTQVARVLSGAVRSSDLVARMGGEEFGILVRRCRIDDAARVAEKARAAVSDTPCPIGTGSVTVHVSGGVACYPDHGTTAEEIFRAADRALSTAKRTGRDRIVVAGS